MSVESSANNISQLNQNWPQASDFISEGDDHIRLLKKVIVQTFKSVKDIVNISHKQLNSVAAALKDESSTEKLDFYEGGAILNKDGTMSLKKVDATAADLKPDSVLNFASLTNVFYPIGSIYTSTLATNPKELLGFGTWVAFAEGRVPVGVGTTGDGFRVEGGKEGGEHKFKLSVAQLPAHKHTFSATTSEAGDHQHRLNAVIIDYSVIEYETVANKPVQGEEKRFNSSQAPTTTSTGKHKHTISGETDNIGSGSDISLLQPYIGVYMWKRTE